MLRRQCLAAGVPNEFWPHHGSLSKEIREETESALKKGDHPATAIATTTLELGIDIGTVKSVAQIGPGPSVAGLRQRLGRSGRRAGEAATLRCYCAEPELVSDMALSDQLREGLIQSVAQIRLLAQRWYEPPRGHGLHLSTLIQQLLSLIAQRGGVTAKYAWTVLFESGVFSGISSYDFVALLRFLGENEILVQDSAGLLLHGAVGERLVNHYSFLAAFTSSDEFRIVHGSRSLGTLPLNRPVDAGSYIIFAGRRWLVLSCEPKERLIQVEAAAGGKVPKFDGMGGKVHDRVREEMRAALASDAAVPFADATAMSLISEARAAYARFRLSERVVVRSGDGVRIFTWRGDWVNDTLPSMLTRRGLRTANEGLSLFVTKCEVPMALTVLRDIAEAPVPRAEDLVDLVQTKLKEKWDHLLPGQLLARNYASRELDAPGAHTAAVRVLVVNEVGAGG
jgi:ATP-dependent Lhr-like helicase